MECVRNKGPFTNHKSPRVRDGKMQQTVQKQMAKGTGLAKANENKRAQYDTAMVYGMVSGWWQNETTHFETKAPPGQVSEGKKMETETILRTSQQNALHWHGRPSFSLHILQP